MPIYPFALFIIALVVYCGLVRKKNMWTWITFYWLLVVANNICQLLGGN